MSSGSQDYKEENVVDEWTTIQKPTRRLRPKIRRNNRMHDASPNPHGGMAAASHKIRDSSKFFENAVAAQLLSTVDSSSSVTQEQIETALETCLRELKGSKYWETVRQVLTPRAETHRHTYQSIVCYGIGTFGTKRPSPPLWQLALAVLIRDHVSSTAQQSVMMHYFEPLMTAEESKVLKKLGIQIIEENERGKRSVKNDDENNNAVTLFFMPHCPMSLYTNLFHTNWDFLRQVVIFGNSLNNYIDGGNSNIVVDPQKQQALKVLEVLQPFWDVHRLQMNKKDVADMAAYFEQAFNDSSVISFEIPNENSTATKDGGWPKRPQLDSLNENDGEVL